MTHRRLGHLPLVATLALAALTAAGCASDPGGRRGPDATLQLLIYTGPPVTIESDGPKHIVVVTTPTGGWSLIWDERAEEAVYLTLRRPDAAFFHTQQLVPHRVGSGVPSGGPLAVHVQVLDHGEPAADRSYALAASAG